MRPAATRPISQAMAHSTGAGQGKRATRRPEPFRKPAYWTDAPPPAPAESPEPPEELGPTRYEDWVRKGIAIDF